MDYVYYPPSLIMDMAKGKKSAPEEAAAVVEAPPVDKVAVVKDAVLSAGAKLVTMDVYGKVIQGTDHHEFEVVSTKTDGDRLVVVLKQLN